MQNATLAFSSPYPFANMAKIFHRYTASGAFSHGANLFRNYMVLKFYHSRLTTAQSAQDSLCGTCTLGLKALALAPSAVANTGDLSGISEGLPIGALGEIDQPKVNANPINGLILALLGHVNRHIQEPFALAKDQIAFTFGKLKKFALAFSTNKLNCDSSANNPDTNRRRHKVERKNFPVIGNGPKWAKLALGFFVPLVSVSHLGDQSENDLRGQRKLIADLPISQTMKRELAKLVLLPRQFRKAVSGIVGGFQCEAQLLGLLGGRQKLDLDRQFQPAQCAFKY